MNTITTRKNKNYTTIFIHAFDDETLFKAVELKHELAFAIIKPKQSALDDYLERFNVIKKIETATRESVGYSFDIGGYVYTKLENSQGCYLTLRDEHIYKLGGISDFGMIQRSDNLMENTFQKKTKELMYF